MERGILLLLHRFRLHIEGTVSKALSSFQVHNLLRNLSSVSPGEEETEILLSSENIVIKRIVSGAQVITPSYCQSEDEWVLLLAGTALINIDGKDIHLTPGDTLFIPRETVHTVLDTAENTVWLAIHLLNQEVFCP